MTTTRKLLAGAGAVAAAVAITVVSLTGTSGPRTFYVSPSGNDTNAGTATAPWKTIAKANAAVQPGDTVLLNGTFTGQAIAPARSGTATAPITYKASAVGASLDRPGLVGTTPYEVYLGGRSYVVIDGLAIGNSNYVAAPVANKGVVLRGSSHITITNCSFSHMQVQLIGSSYSTISDNTFRDFVASYVNPSTGQPDPNHPNTSGDMLNLVLGSHDNSVVRNTMSYAGHSLIEVGRGAGNTLETNAANVIDGNTLSNPWYDNIILSDNGAGTVVSNNQLLDSASVPTLYSTVAGRAGQLVTAADPVQFSGENFTLTGNTISNAVAVYGIVTFGARWYTGPGSAPGGTLVESLNNQVYGNTIQNSKGAAAFSFVENYNPATDATSSACKALLAAGRPDCIPRLTNNAIHDNTASGLGPTGFSWDRSLHFETVLFRSFKGAGAWTGLGGNSFYANAGVSSTGAYRYSYVDPAGTPTTRVYPLSQFQAPALFDPLHVYGNT